MNSTNTREITDVKTDHDLRTPASDAPPGVAPLDGYAHPGFEWVNNIACEGMDQSRFFAKAGHVLDDAAKAACLSCDVWRECLIWSYLGGGDGKPLNGGYFALLSPGQRKKMSLGQAMEHVAEMRVEAAAEAVQGGLDLDDRQ